MGATKKPRKAYKPKPRFQSPLEYVLESSKPLADHDDYVLKWSLKNHAAFGALMAGQATKAEIDTMVAARNIVEALIVTLKGKDTDGTLDRSSCALIEICDRANAGKGTVMKAAEMQAMRDLLGLHDELLAVVSVRQFDQALTWARREISAGRAATLKEPI